MMNELEEERVKALAIGFTEYAQEHGYSEAEACFSALVLAAGIAPVAMKKEVMRFFADCLDGSHDIKMKG